MNPHGGGRRGTKKNAKKKSGKTIDLAQETEAVPAMTPAEGTHLAATAGIPAEETKAVPAMTPTGGTHLAATAKVPAKGIPAAPAELPTGGTLAAPAAITTEEGTQEIPTPEVTTLAAHGAADVTQETVTGPEIITLAALAELEAAGMARETEIGQETDTHTEEEIGMTRTTGTPRIDGANPTPGVAGAGHGRSPVTTNVTSPYKCPN